MPPVDRNSAQSDSLPVAAEPGYAEGAGLGQSYYVFASSRLGSFLRCQLDGPDMRISEADARELIRHFRSIVWQGDASDSETVVGNESAARLLRGYCAIQR